MTTWQRSPGLTSEQARFLLAQYGPNRLVPERRQAPWLGWLLKALGDPMVLLLLAAGVTYLALRDFADAAVSMAAIVPITAVTLALEVRAERALEQLKRLTAPTATVWRDGRRQVVPAEDIVPDDQLFLQEGDVVPADGVLVEGKQLMLDESALTGESQPVPKDEGDEHERRQVYAGTTVLSGRGAAQVTATGANTRYGKIGALVAQIRQPPTPLQRLIRRLIQQLALVAVLFCLAVVIAELARGEGWGGAIIAGVSLAIAVIPEEFPMVYTLYLGLGAWRLARDRALVRRLPGVEALGATTVICTDKTGTLTLGKVEVAALQTAAGVVRPSDALGLEPRMLLEAAVMASEPGPFDPLEQALVRCATSQGVDVAELHSNGLVQDYPFDPVQKYMSHVWSRDGATQVYAKGSVEGILRRSRAPVEVREWAERANHALASEGMRVIAVAAGDARGPTGERGADESGLKFQGLVAFSDPPRPGVAEALQECRTAGIRVVMITGDHPVTAHAVAEGLDLPHDDEPIPTGDDLDATGDEALNALVQRANIFARTRPEQKYRLVRALRAQGEVVAMTGDGINDAPALREADIGVAMGQRGTEVARSSATLVLMDDNFSTIVAAILDGRRIFENMRRAFSYLIAFHAPLLLLALAVPLAGAPLLLLPIHLVWLEIIVHPTASLVFEADPVPPDLMRRRPRRAGTGLLATADLLRSLGVGLALFVGVLLLYLALEGRGLPLPQARGAALATLILGQALMVLAERSPARPFWRASLRGNKMLAPVLMGTVGSVLAALYIPPLAGLLRLAPPSPLQWGVAAGVALAATLWAEPFKPWLRWRFPVT